MNMKLAAPAGRAACRASTLCAPMSVASTVRFASAIQPASALVAMNVAGCMKGGYSARLECNVDVST